MSPAGDVRHGLGPAQVLIPRHDDVSLWTKRLHRQIANLKPHYRMLLAEQGFVLIYARPMQFKPE
jgi:hypothetical protein